MAHISRYAVKAVIARLLDCSDLLALILKRVESHGKQDDENRIETMLHGSMLAPG